MSPTARPAIAVIGDTQRTSRLERTFLRREQNDQERELLLHHLFEQKFELLVHLGDMVVKGSSQRAWQEFDRLFARIYAEEIPFQPLLGNHEYWGDRRRMLMHLRARFPKLEHQRWQAQRHGPLGLILLDSNMAQYSKTDWLQQQHWFQFTLREMEENSAVRAILVFSHHPPFTNSARIRGAQFIEKNFLPAFFAAHKTLAWISGHVHGYERFDMHGKAFIVSAGGGGPRLRLRTNTKARHPDQFQYDGPRPFNYLLIHPEEKQLRIEVMGLDKGQAQIRLIDEIAKPYQASAMRR